MTNRVEPAEPLLLTRSSSKSRTSVLKQQISEKSRHAYRDAILAAAEHFLSSGSPQHMKVKDIADAAGVSVGTVYNYFRDKDAVFTALEERQNRQLFDALAQPYSTNEPAQQLEEFVRRTLFWLERTRNVRTRLACRRPLRDGASESDVALQVLGEWTSDYVFLLEERLSCAIEAQVVRSDRSTEELGWYLRLLLRAIVAEWTEAGRQESMSARSNVLVCMFLEGASCNALSEIQSLSVRESVRPYDVLVPKPSSRAVTKGQ